MSAEKIMSRIRYFAIICGLLQTVSLNAVDRTDYLEAFYGGGIGYTATLLGVPVLDLPPSSESPDFSGPAFFHGVQGWGLITDDIRIGATVIAGSRKFTEMVAGTDTTVYSKLTLSSAFLFGEYVIPLSPRTQTVLNLSLGITNVSVKYLRNVNGMNWNDLFTDPGRGTHLTLKNAPTLMPEVSWMWQFSQRGGLRLNTALLVYFLPQSGWKVDDFYTVSNAASGNTQILTSPLVQAILYFGI